MADILEVVEDTIPSEPTSGNDTLVGASNSDRIDLLEGDDVFAAGGGSDIASGGDGNDAIEGESGNDTLHGDDGNDTLIGGAGRDALFGGGNEDLIDGGNQEDLIDGGEGNDTLIGDKGDDTIVGGDGDDDINGGQDNDNLSGGTGNDIFRIRNGEGQDTIADFTLGEDLLDVSLLGVWDISQLTIQDVGTGLRINTGNGNFVELTGLSAADLNNANFILDEAPVITPTLGGDSIFGTTGDDNYTGGAGSDLLKGRDGNDTLDGGQGNDTLNGGAGDDVIIGGSGVDRIYGGSGNDTITGDASNDVINGASGNDLIDGGSNNDRLYGGEGDDTLIGEHGNDRLYGEEDDDLLDGGAGKDRIDGGAGNDTLLGGQGADQLTGGAGNDLFVFDDRMRADTVTDFDTNGDILDVSAWGFTDISELGFVQQGADVFAQLSDRDSLLLENVDLASLDNSDLVLAEPTGPTEFADDLVGTAGADSIDGLGGNDTIDGGAGNDTLTGGAGEDVLTGGAGADIFVFGELSGNDTITDFNPLEDTIEITGTTFLVQTDITSGTPLIQHTGGTITVENLLITTLDEFNAFQDAIDTTFFVPIATPTEGADDLIGTDAAESIDGLGGDDTIDGGAGNDTLTGGAGEDMLTGGAGEDIFVFNELSGNDTITDFNPLEDTIEITGTAFLVQTDITSGTPLIQHTGGTITVENLLITTLDEFNAFQDAIDTTFTII
ncbi:MAG: calcium-binding protein [Tateyamaria sp.]|uniref:calcium-binding protein n=1 Tax=Tateyamaria sp. TaxID=1929288 RepID=UPI003268D718